jgi:hypothetical protein
MADFASVIKKSKKFDSVHLCKVQLAAPIAVAIFGSTGGWKFKKLAILNSQFNSEEKI